MRTIDWKGTVIPAAREIVLSYDTGVTLRQLFYRLVAGGYIENRQNNYKTLSDRTARAREAGEFPELIDMTRHISGVGWSYEDADTYLGDVRDRGHLGFRLNHTLGQNYAVYLGVEKAGLRSQLETWFDDLDVPVLALQGNASHTFCVEVRRHVRRDGRPAVLLYAGDFDPSGIQILEDFVRRSRCWTHVVRVALNEEQVGDMGLLVNPAPEKDSDAAEFIRRYPHLIEEHGFVPQVEVDAIDPTDLQTLFRDEFDNWWDSSAYDGTMEQQEHDRRRLADAFAQLPALA